MYMKRICIPVLKKDKYLSYKSAVEKLNAQAVFICEEHDSYEYDGLLLPGGADINPARYNQANNGSVDIKDDLDDLQFNVLAAFVKAKKPILGICRGQQLLNVYFKGTLIQDIKEKDNHRCLDSLEDKYNTIVTEDNTFINEIYGKRFISNSSHHQAVDILGEGLKVAARCDDGIIEAVEHVGLPIWAVQFHPERMKADESSKTADGSKIIAYFLDKC